MNRRNFIRMSLAIGVAMAIPFSKVLGADDTICLGVIGVGPYTNICVSRNYRVLFVVPNKV